MRERSIHFKHPHAYRDTNRHSYMICFGSLYTMMLYCIIHYDATEAIYQ